MLLHRVRDVKGCTIAASDGAIGKVTDLYFDDEAWGVRYLAVDTGSWLAGREVLISPMAVKRVDIAGGTITVGLTREQVRNSPDIDTHKPVSRQHERDYLGYYGHPIYWGGPFLWGYWGLPGQYAEGASPTVSAEQRELEARGEPERSGDAHLRSTNGVAGYRIHATDDSIGEIDDFVLDDEAWAIRYLVVDTRLWWPGGLVLVAVNWIRSIDWQEREVRVELTREQVRNSPPYDSASPVGREYESRLHAFYGSEGYWT